MEISEALTQPKTLESDRSASPGFLFQALAGQRREWVFWTLQTLFWSAIGMVGFLMTQAFRASVPDVHWAIFVRVSTGFMLSSGLRWIYLRQGFRKQKRSVRWGLVVTCCVALALAEMSIIRGLNENGILILDGTESGSLRLFGVRLFILMVWSALYFAFHLIEREHALELRAVKAELAARENELRQLQAQMNPHFLLNALDGVLVCKDDPDAVDEVTRSLAEYLRFLLQETRTLEPLSRELDAIEKFLSVQTSRFDRNLVCRIHWDSVARAVMVPPMLIQPLLENAFQSKPQELDSPLHIWLTAAVELDVLRVNLSSTGVSAAADGDMPGKGIQALRQRLKLLLGSDAQLEMTTDDGWTRVTILIRSR